MQYPERVLLLYERDAHNCLTHAGLAAFVSCLYREVSAGRTPNEDRILKEIDDRQVVTFIRDLQVKTPSQAESTIDEAFENVVG